MDFHYKPFDHPVFDCSFRNKKATQNGYLECVSSGNGRFGWLYKFNCTVNNCLGTTFGNLAASLSMEPTRV